MGRRKILRGDKRIARVPLASRFLITVRADDDLWTIVLPGKQHAGALVRIEPPAEAAQGDIDGLRARLLASGAVGVRVMPKATATAAQGPSISTDNHLADLSLRERVMRRADSLVGVRDLDALKEELNESLTSTEL